METLETVEYKGHNIDIYYDEAPECPWESWDSLPPLIVAHGDGLTVYGDIDRVPPDLDEKAVRAHARDIAAALGGPTLLRALRPDREYYSGYSGYSVIELVNVAIYDQWSYNSTDSEKLELLQAVYGWLGVPCVLRTARGYSKGDQADVLAVATEDWRRGVGAAEDRVLQVLDEDINLWAAWAFGDVYGYMVTQPRAECVAPRRVDSCWGYYGSDHEKSGLLDAAREAIDYAIQKEDTKAIHVKYQAATSSLPGRWVARDGDGEILRMSVHKIPDGCRHRTEAEAAYVCAAAAQRMGWTGPMTLGWLKGCEYVAVFRRGARPERAAELDTPGTGGGKVKVIY